MKANNLVEFIKNDPDAITNTGASQEKVLKAEEILGIKFAPDYREYLLTFGIAISDGHELTGLSNLDRTNVIKVTIANREMGNEKRKDMYVVEEANIDGIVVWQKEDGTVYTTVFEGEPRLRYKNLFEYVTEQA